MVSWEEGRSPGQAEAARDSPFLPARRPRDYREPPRDPFGARRWPHETYETHGATAAVPRGTVHTAGMAALVSGHQQCQMGLWYWVRPPLGVRAVRCRHAEKGG